MPLRPLLAVAFVLVALPARARAIDVSEVRWGFDGRATPHCFNLLSVLINNPGPVPFEGLLELRESIGGGTRVGAPLVDDLYVAPYSSRWVQFYPYVKEAYEDWSLHWGRRASESADVPHHVLSEQRPVLLVESDEMPSKSGSIRHFPENLFPPLVTATDSLKTVVLDHVPQWEEARRQAFYDWLFRGGRLDLFKDVNGTYPQFSAGLSELNAPFAKFRIGNGRVFRHDRMRSQIDPELMEKIFGAKPNAPDKPPDSQEEQLDDQIANGNVSVSQVGFLAGGRGNVLFPDLAGGLFAYLKSLTRADHNWTLIYSMAVIYIVTVVPGVHFLGRKRFDFRIVYGSLICAILLFSLVFDYFGRRGNNEANAVNTLAIARQLPGGMLDVTSWSNVFVINGADYEIVHGGTGRLYATAQTFEAVNGVIRNGAIGRFDVDIPPFSSQPFLSRTKTKADNIQVNIHEFSANGKVSRLSLTPGKEFPQPAGRDFTYALYGGQLYPLALSNGRLEMNGRPIALTEFLGSIEWNDISPFAMRFGNFRGQNSQAMAPPRFDFLFRPLVAWSLNLKRRSDIPIFKSPDDRLRLFIWSELPDSLKVENSRIPNQKGRVLYVVDIPKPVKP